MKPTKKFLRYTRLSRTTCSLGSKALSGAILIFFLMYATAWGQRRISIEDFTSKSTFAQKSIKGIKWLSDGTHYTILESGKIVKFDIHTGRRAEVLVDGATLSPSLAITDYTFNSNETKILIETNPKKIYRRSYTASYFIFDIASRQVTALSNHGELSCATFSPDGRHVAFARDNNLFYISLDNMLEIQITADGKKNQVINGTTDWVYEEEWGFVKAFVWSPDSKRIAYYRFDESQVKEYTLQKWNANALYPENYTYKYPKAGEDNSQLSVWIHDLPSGTKKQVDLGNNTDIYIPSIMWTNASTQLSVRRMNRLQNTMELLHADAATGRVAVILKEQSETFVDAEYNDELRYLNDGRHFIYASERSGFKHLYLYTMNGELIHQITSGTWEVTTVSGVDERRKKIYYISTEQHHHDRQFYEISFNGKNKRKISVTPGTHAIDMSKDFRYFMDHFSNAENPLQVGLYETAGGKMIRSMEDNKSLKESLATYALSPKHFFNFTAGDGKTSLDAFMLKPRELKPGVQYPVLVYQYSGPRSVNVSNSFGGSYFYWFQMLVQQGYIVVVADVRGTGQRGVRFVDQTYRQLGKLELEDIQALAKSLGQYDYIDTSRLGIYGWSYGGYMAALAMTKGAGTFKVGIAGAPVTSWRFYDNIYTERYLQRPQDNPEGYDENSPLHYADRLKGKFLLIHGTGDDNVHVQNSLALANALIASGKQFDSFYYPDDAHNLPGTKRAGHLFQLMTNYILGNL